MEIDKAEEHMEVDDASASTSRKQILAKTIQPSVTISLHPLVLMNISEHWTRIRAQEGSAQPVYGALIGKQEGRKIEVFNSFELKYEIIDGDVNINRDYYNTKEEQCKSDMP
jgi:COP9 signalosome complex subunit 6